MIVGNTVRCPHRATLCLDIDIESHCAQSGIMFLVIVFCRHVHTGTNAVSQVDSRLVVAS